MTMSKRVFFGVLALTVLSVGFVVGGVAYAIGDKSETGVEIGETFTGEVKSYFGPEGPQPYVICIYQDGEDPCGTPIEVEPASAPKPGSEVTVTEMYLKAADDGERELAFYVQP